MKHGKKYNESVNLIEKGKFYDVEEAVAVAVKTGTAKFDETVEIHVRLGVDSRHADQQVRGAVVLPNGTGKTVKVLVFAVLAAVVFGAVSASAFESYNTYTYSIDGEPIDSPAAYTTSPQEVYNSTDMGLTTKFGGTKIGKSTDIATDEEGRVYLTDPEGDRIVILDKHFKAIGVISEYVDENGKECKLDNPRGVFATDPTISATGEDNIYVADTGNKKIVVFDGVTFEYVRTIDKPDDDIVAPDAYTPASVAVDLYGRIFGNANKLYLVISLRNSRRGISRRLINRKRRLIAP